MWVVRELSRLLVRVGVAVAVASAIAGVKAAVSGGPLLHTWRITLFALAAVMLLLAGAGRGASHRRVNLGIDHGPTSIFRIPGLEPKPDEPSLTASAVFVGSALVLFALAILV